MVKMRQFWPLATAILFGCAGSRSVNLEANLKNCPKKILVFIDEKAEKDLKSKDVSVSDLLVSTNKNFSDQGLDFEYDVSSLEIRKIESDKILRSYDALFNFFIKTAYKNKYNKHKAILFLSGNNPDWARKTSSAAISFYDNKNMGNGEIIIFTNHGEEVDSKFLDRHYLMILLTHETAHLWGVKHSKDEYSIMYSQPKYDKFDEYSKNKIQKALKKSKKCLNPVK